MNDMDKGENYLLNLFKSMRLQRSLIPVSFIILTCGFANTINLQVFLLIACCILIYAIGGIYNAKLDKDIKLKNSTIIIAILLSIALVLSFSDYIILAAVLVWFLLNFVYSKYSRFILLGDSIILSITHAVVPIIFTSLIVGLDFKITFFISIFSFVLMNLIIPMKNFKGVQKDKFLHYKTLNTVFRSGKLITTILFDLSLILLVISYFILNIKFTYPMILLILFIDITVNYLILQKRFVIAYEVSRLYVLVISLAYVISFNSEKIIMLLSLLLVILYFIYLVFWRESKWNPAML